MNLKIIVISITAGILIFTGYLASFNYFKITPKLVACTMEAKLCPDGSAVGRTGPNCEFEKCPTLNFNPKSYGPLCDKIAGRCNGIVAINCHAEVDGPFYYVNESDGKIIADCGGDLLQNPKQCPPKEWTCD